MDQQRTMLPRHCSIRIVVQEAAYRGWVGHADRAARGQHQRRNELAEIEGIRHVAQLRIGIPIMPIVQRRQLKDGLHQLHQRGKLIERMRDMRMLRVAGGIGIGRDDEHRRSHAIAKDIDKLRCHVVIEAPKVIPQDDDGGI